MTITTAPQPPPRTRTLRSIRVPRLARRARGVVLSLAVALGAALLPLPATPASADAVVATIPVGADVDRIVFSPDGALAYATLPQDDAIAVIDLASRTVLQRIPVGAWPNDIALAADGTTAFVANMVAHRIDVIALPTRTVAASIVIGNSPIHLALTPDGTTIVVTIRDAQRVLFVDIGTATVTPLGIGAYPGELAVSPDGTTAYVARSNDIAVIDIPSRSVIGAIPVGVAPRQLVLSPDGATAYVGYNALPRVDIVDAHGGRIDPRPRAALP